MVLLQTRSFQNQSGGTTYVPDFKIVGWEFWEPDTPAEPLQPIAVPIAPPGKPAAAKLSAPGKPKRDDMDDEVPF